MQNMGRKMGWLWSLLLTLAGTGGVYGLTAIVLMSRAIAYTARADVTISRAVGETYEGFIRRAETVARAAVQRSFDQDILVTDVSITILGENRGSIAPVVLINVTRQSWRSRPDPQQWATYFPTTRLLLGFDSLAPGATPAAPQAAPQTVPQGVPVLPNGQPITPNNGGSGTIPGGGTLPVNLNPGTVPVLPNGQQITPNNGAGTTPGGVTAPVNLNPGTVTPKTPPIINIPNRR